MRLLVYTPVTFATERKYVLDVVFGQWLGVAVRHVTAARRDTLVTLPGDGAPSFRMPDVLFAADETAWPDSAVWPDEPCRLWEPAGEGLRVAGLTQPMLPVLFSPRTLSDRTWAHSDQRARLDVDVLGTVFWLITRMEEFVRPALDIHKRFPASASHAMRAGYLHRPLADEWVAVLATALQQVFPALVFRTKLHRVVPTHDVDRPYKHLFQSPVRLVRDMVADTVRRRNPRHVINAPRAWLRVKQGFDEADPFQTFDWLMQENECLGLRGTFFFIAGHSAGRIDGDYAIQHPRIRSLIRRIHQRGHEIGLHASYNTYLRPDLIADEFASLRRVCEREGVQQSSWGSRQHVLRFQVPHTWSALSEAGLAYDSTLGYADHVGFRCGTCQEYSTFSLTQRRPLAVRERPLIMMETTLLEKRYQGLSMDRAEAVLAELRSSCQASGGDFVLLWHNCVLSDSKLRSLYLHALQ